jgi:AraC-like DNA-binding protein
MNNKTSVNVQNVINSIMENGELIENTITISELMGLNLTQEYENFLHTHYIDYLMENDKNIITDIIIEFNNDISDHNLENKLNYIFENGLNENYILKIVENKYNNNLYFNILENYNDEYMNFCCEEYIDISTDMYIELLYNYNFESELCENTANANANISNDIDFKILKTFNDEFYLIYKIHDGKSDIRCNYSENSIVKFGSEYDALESMYINEFFTLNINDIIYEVGFNSINEQVSIYNTNTDLENYVHGYFEQGELINVIIENNY